MEIPAIVGQQYAFLLPVGLVIVCAVLVFAFGFKSSVEPPSFKQLGLSADDKKSLKKKKLKDKKSQSNGHATVLADETDGRRDQSVKALKQSNRNEPAKTRRSEEHEKQKDKKQDNQKSPSKQEKKPVKKSGKENTPVKAVKSSGKNKDEKPTDYDEGKWETAISRKDKKNKKKEEEVVSPANSGKGAEKKKANKKKEQEKKQENVAQSPKTNKSPKNKEVQKKTSEKQGEVVLTPTAKGEAQDNQDAKKKSKKKSAIEKSDENVPVIKENAGGKQSKNSTPSKKPVAPKTVNTKESEPLKDKKNLPEPPSGAASNDVWKEAPQKKSKKKVRKD